MFLADPRAQCSIEISVLRVLWTIRTLCQFPSSVRIGSHPGAIAELGTGTEFNGAHKSASWIVCDHSALNVGALKSRF